MSRISHKQPLELILKTLNDTSKSVQQKIKPPEIPVVSGIYTIVASVKSLWAELRPEAGSLLALRQQLISLSKITAQLLNHENGTKPLSDKSINSMSDTLKAMQNDGANNINTLVEKHLGHGDINGLKVLRAYADLRAVCTDLSPSSELYADSSKRLLP